MKTLLAALAVTTALTLPGMALARPVTLTTTLNDYGGNGAYLAFYVTDAQGAYIGSLWMAGGKSKYYEHLSDWYRATAGNPAEINGITGASVGAGANSRSRLISRTRSSMPAMCCTSTPPSRICATAPPRSSCRSPPRARARRSGPSLHRLLSTTCEAGRRHDPDPAPMARPRRRGAACRAQPVGGRHVGPAGGRSAARAGARQRPGSASRTSPSRIEAAYPGVEQIRRAPSGRITAYWFDGGIPAPPSSTRRRVAVSAAPTRPPSSAG